MLFRSPLLSFSILEALEVLININVMLAKHIRAIHADKDACMKYVDNNPLIITAFLPCIGYERCEKLLKEFFARSDKQLNIKKFLKEKLGEQAVERILSPESLMSLGYRDNAKSA